MSDRSFFFFTETGRRWEERFVRGGGLGVVTVETVSNHTVIIHRRKYTRPRYCLFCCKTNIFPSLLLPLLGYLPLVMCWVSEGEAAVYT